MQLMLRRSRRKQSHALDLGKDRRAGRQRQRVLRFPGDPRHDTGALAVSTQSGDDIHLSAAVTVIRQGQ
jgi:hypothetical protein